MIKIDLSKPIISERDPFRGKSYCVECFSPRTKEYFWFYNGYGPFCNKKCFSEYVGVEYEKLPSCDYRGILK